MNTNATVQNEATHSSSEDEEKKEVHRIKSYSDVQKMKLAKWVMFIAQPSSNPSLGEPYFPSQDHPSTTTSSASHGLEESVFILIIYTKVIPNAYSH